MADHRTTNAACFARVGSADAQLEEQLPLRPRKTFFCQRFETMHQLVLHPIHPAASADDQNVGPGHLNSGYENLVPPGKIRITCGSLPLCFCLQAPQ